MFMPSRAIGVAIVLFVSGAIAAPPPNAPASVEWNAGSGRLQLRYGDSVILDAVLRAEDSLGREVAGLDLKLERTEAPGEKVEQLLKFLPANAREGVTLVLRGTVTGSEEAFPAETAGEAQRRFPFVRNSIGLSRNLRNNAVYDRRLDWVLVGPGDGATHILPKTVNEQPVAYAWESRGTAIELVFRPRFYQKHRGLSHFEPWTYRVWEGPVTGYCTWWAYRDGFSQKTLDAIVDVFADKKLPDFGYKYIQLDDAYQIGNGSCPQNWLTWNTKFPGGPDYALRKIKSAGMEGGIWVHRVHRPSDPHVADIGKKHPEWFVAKPDGKLFMEGGFYVLNTKNREALDGMVRPIYRELKKQGWGYVKIDGAGDLLNAYKNKNCADHFKRIGSTPEESLRDWDRVAREELGKDVYILSCWGTGPGVNVIGLADGCRLSDDGFQPETLSRFSSYEGVVWRNDPDHCDIMGTWLTDQNAMMPVFGLPAPAPVRTIVRPVICSLAGGVLMVSDKAEVYKDDRNLEGMKRSAPVLSTVPGQLYDPGHKADTWWLQEIDRPFEHWSVLARIQWAQKRGKEWVFDLKGAPRQEVRFADLGLAADRDHLVFEFWTQKFLGKFKGSFVAPAMDTNNGMDIFAIREARPHPWVISTTRHISQGGVDLLDEQWDAAAKTLAGRSSVVAGDPYVLNVHLPGAFRIQSAEADGKEIEFANGAEVGTVRIKPSATGTVAWNIRFAQPAAPDATRASRGAAPLPGLRKLMDTPLRDTSICRGPDGAWYLTGTVEPFWGYNEGIKLWRSKDMKDWEPLGFVWKYGASPWHKPCLEKKKPLWAPEIHYLKDTFWLTYSMPGWDGTARTSGSGLLKSTTGKSEGPYVDMQPDARMGDEIDASLFQDDDGAVYFLWHSGKIAKMKPDMSGLAEPYRWLKSTVSDPNPKHHSGLCAGIFGKASFGHVGYEGMFLFKANKRYYLACSENFDGRYSCTIAMADNIYGPYGERYEALPHAGHNTFFKDEQGQWWSTYFGSDGRAPWQERPGVLPIEFDADGRVRPARIAP